MNLTWRVQEREDPTLTDWDRFARAEYVRLAMEEEGEFRASDGQNEIWVQQNLEVSAAPPRHCLRFFLALCLRAVHANAYITVVLRIAGTLLSVASYRGESMLGSGIVLSRLSPTIGNSSAAGHHPRVCGLQLRQCKSRLL